MGGDQGVGYYRWEEKTSLIRCHLSRSLNKVGAEGAEVQLCRYLGIDYSRQTPSDVKT